MSDCVCVCGWVYLSLYMARIYGCGVVNVAAYLVSVCEMHFMNLLWLLMWRHLHRAAHSHPHIHTHAHRQWAPPGADFMRHWRHTINVNEWPRRSSA